MELISVKEYANRKGVSCRTVYRMRDRGELDAEKVGRQWRIRLPRTDRSTAVDVRGHHEALLDLFESASMELRSLVDAYPHVMNFLYHPDDPSNALYWVTREGMRRVELALMAERQHAWQYLREHLHTGLPGILAAFGEVKSSFGRYWQEISEWETEHRQKAQLVIDEEGRGVGLDDSQFFRTILAEVDRGEGVPKREDYQLVTETRQVLVRCAGTGIVSARDLDHADKWLTHHLGWRRQFVGVRKPGLMLVRAEVKTAARSFVRASEEVQIGGRVPGRCRRCPSDQTVVDAEMET